MSQNYIKIVLLFNVFLCLTVELMEYKVQQEKVLSEDLSSSLEVEKSRSLELASMLSREKNSHSDLQAEIVETQGQINKLKDALEREQTRLVSAS